MLRKDGKVELLGEVLEPEYLGDGAYVVTNGDVFAIFATDGIAIHEVVYLDKHGLENLNNFVKNKTGQEFPS